MSFRLRMVLFILIPIIVVLLFMSFFSYTKAKFALSDTIDRQLSTMVKIQGESLYATMVVYKNIADELSNETFVKNYLVASTETSNLDEDITKSSQEELDRFISSFDTFYSIGVVDNTGQIVLDSNKEHIGKKISFFDQLQKVKEGQDLHHILTNDDKSLGLAISMPVFMNNKRIGFVYVSVNLEIITQRTIDHVKFAKSGTAVVFDNTGTVIMHQNRGIIGKNMSSTDEFKEVSRVKTGIITYEFLGNKRIAYVYHIDWLDWYLSFPVWEDDLFSTVNSLFYSNITIVSISLFVLFVIILVVAKKISSALGGIERISHKVSEGELDLTAEENELLQNIAKRTDEIGGLASSFNKMIIVLLDALEESKNAYKTGMITAAEKLQSIIDNCTQSTQELSVQIQESSNGADIQAQRISETVVSIEQMNSAILEVTQNTVQTAQIADETRIKAEESEKVVQDFMCSIKKVDGSAVTLKSDMDELNKHVLNINKVMAVISDLADQTNLLALNAAIEAARAGEFGKGFSVVADEVRKLAEKTMASTVDVSRAVEAIQNSTKSSREQAESTVALVETATKLATRCQRTLEEIVELASTSAERIGSIAIASEHQSTTSEEITHTLADINQIVSQTNSGMSKAKNAIMNLSQQTSNLSTMAKSMKE